MDHSVMNNLSLHDALPICRVPDDATTGAGGQAVARMLRREGFAVTELLGKGRENDVVMLNIVVPRRNVSRVMRIIGDSDPDAFVSVEEVRTTRGGYIRPGGRKMPFFSNP